MNNNDNITWLEGLGFLLVIILIVLVFAIVE